MKPSNLLTRLTRRRTVCTTLLLVMLLVASLMASLTGLAGATPGRLLPIPGMASASSLAASSLAHANAQGISAPASASAPLSATSPKQEQEQEQSQQLEPGQPTTPLERVLNKDGTLKLSTGFSGSVDPNGWRMETGLNGQPHFVKSDERQQHQQHPPAKPRSATFSPSPLASGDENWDDRFGTLGMNNYVWAIAISGSDVYVGGDFDMAGGVPANSIAKWDGSSWSALGSGVSGGSPHPYVNEIAISGSDVYASGSFTTAGGVPANCIAKWDGSTWSALGGGVSGDYTNVKTIGINGSDVYVGGTFTTAGGVSANRIAKWDVSSWSALGSGVSGGSSLSTVWAIAVSSSDVYVGGEFNTAGVNPSNRFAIWHMPPVANLVGHVTWAGSSQPDTRQMQPLTLTLCSTSGGSTHTYTATTDASGYFTINVASLISGTNSTYNWREKGTRSLANGGTLTLTGGNQQAEMGVQAGGDADNDNVVGAGDFNILKATFNSATDLRADFNNDGVTGIQDFNILKGNFGQGGAPVTCP